MINSMTGYGEAEGEAGGVTYRAEIRTVNNRYLKTALKLPEAAAFLEEEIEKLLRRNLSRGTVNYALRVKDVGPNLSLDINEPALQGLVKRLAKTARSAGIEATIDVGGLLGLPGIAAPAAPDEQTVQQIREVVLRITQEALDKLTKMRAAEGAAIAAELDGYCKAIKQVLAGINARGDVVLREYHDALKKRVDQMLAESGLELDQQVLAREVAVFAERSDIAEEAARLDYHLQQFAEGCRADVQAGRKLEFIAQELLREANTIASKACNAEIVRGVIDMKCSIDRIKEQIQNVE